MSFSESEFKPKVTRMGSGASVRIVDPNPLQEIVPLEDLFIYVSLRAKQKSKSILTEIEGPKLSLINENRSSIDLVTPQKIDGANLFSSKSMLTTDWTEIGGHNFSATKVGNNGKDFEGFGITNIDIEIKSQQTPKFVINFTDVRGATLFEQGSCSPYGLFFNLPYPMFELTVKGYYGKPVNYYLNLTKFNTKFNSETGNMDCTAEFIGYTFAFLSDVIVGYVAASQELPEEKYSPQGKLRAKYKATRDYYVKNGLTSYNNSGDAGPWCDDPAVNPNKCTTISDLVQQLKRFETVEKPEIGGSNENIELEGLTNLLAAYTNYKSAVTSLARKLEETYGITPESSKSTKMGNPKKARFVFKNQAVLNKLLDPINGDLNLSFNQKTGSFLSYISEIKKVEVTKDKKGDDILGSNSVLTKYTALEFAGPGPFPEIYNVLKGEDWNYKVLNGTDLTQSDYTIPLMLQNTLSPYLDLGFIIDDIEKEIEFLSGENGIITQKRKLLIEAVNDIIEATLGFKPTIRNVFSVLLCNTDAFMEILLEVYGKAQNYHSEQKYGNNLVTVGGDNEILTSGDKNNTVIYPWPTYFKKNHFSETSSVSQGTREVYPGIDFPNWWEVIFVEDFIKAYMKFVNKQEIINGDVQGKPGYDNYVPINPLESRIMNKQQQPIKYYEKTTPKEILTIIGERLFITLDNTLFQPMRLTYDAVKMPLGFVKDGKSYYDWNPIKTDKVTVPGEIIETLAIIDSWNLLNTIEGESGRTLIASLNSYTENNIVEAVISSLKERYPNELTLEYSNSIDLTKYYGVNGEGLNANEMSKYGYTSKSLVYKFTPKLSNELIGLELYSNNGTAIMPNPHNMDPKLLFNITTEQEINDSGIKEIGIFKDDFKTQIDKLGQQILKNTKSVRYTLDEYYIPTDENIFTTKLSSSDSSNINYSGNGGGTNSVKASGHFIPAFESPKLFTVLYMTLSNTGEESTWFKNGGKIEDLKASAMGTIGFWLDDDTRGVSLLQDGPNKYKRIFNKSSKFDGDNYPSLIDESKDRADNIEPADDVTSGSGDGIITPIVTTPFWLDNINKFRIEAGGSRLIKGNGQEDIDNEIQNNNLAYIYLHTLKTTPLISRHLNDNGKLTSESTIQSLRSLMMIGGLTKVPKAWLLTLGAQLWRWKTFVGTKQNAEGKTIWNKPLTCVLCGQGDKPNGFDPLAQPGYNSIEVNGTDYPKRKYINIDQSVAGVMDRNNVPLYLNSIYGLSEAEVISKIQKSVFSPNHQGINDNFSEDGYRQSGTCGSQKVGQIFEGGTTWSFYFNSFRYANINKSRMGNLKDGLRDNDDDGTVINVINETKKYSWSQNWIAPHHLMYVNPEKLMDKNFLNQNIIEQGSGSGFILLFEPNVGIIDYPSIMNESYRGNDYSEGKEIKEEEANVLVINVNTFTGITETRKKQLELFKSDNVSRSKIKDGNLGMIIQYIPDEIKDMIVEKFTTWAKSDDWKSYLKLIDPINFEQTLNIGITDYYEYNKVVAKELLGLPFGGKASCLTLKEDKDQIDRFKKSLLDEQYWIINSTPKIWYGIGTKDQVDNGTGPNQFIDAFLATKSQVDKYLKAFIKNFNEKSKEKIKDINKEETEKNKDNDNTSIMDDTDTKLALYRTFKSISDKWISASKKQSDTSKPSLFFNLIENGDGTTCKGQRGSNIQDGSSDGSGPRPTLASHFQYVNRVMGDIGDEAVIDISKLSELTNNPKISLYQYLADVLVENNYLFFPLPAFVNFTGNGLVDNDLVDMFRPVNTLKSISCGPLFLSMYVGGSSRQLSMVPNTTCGLDQEALNNIQDDSFTISKQEIDVNRQPFDTTNPNLVNSDGFTAFKVVYGLDTQNHFKSIQLDQSEFSETAESLLVIEKLSQQGGGDQTSKGQNLNAMYLTRSYSCTVESLGNMMIQPMTYFDLIGVPMFSGAYLITEVKHSFTPNNAKTSFKGVRQPRMTTPIVTDAATAMNITFKNNAPTGKSIGGRGAGGIYGGSGNVLTNKVTKDESTKCKYSSCVITRKGLMCALDNYPTKNYPFTDYESWLSWLVTKGYTTQNDLPKVRSSFDKLNSGLKINKEDFIRLLVVESGGGNPKAGRDSNGDPGPPPKDPTSCGLVKCCAGIIQFCTFGGAPKIYENFAVNGIDPETNLPLSKYNNTKPRTPQSIAENELMLKNIANQPLWRQIDYAYDYMERGLKAAGNSAMKKENGELLLSDLYLFVLNPNSINVSGVDTDLKIGGKQAKILYDCSLNSNSGSQGVAGSQSVGTQNVVKCNNPRATTLNNTSKFVIMGDSGVSTISGKLSKVDFGSYCGGTGVKFLLDSLKQEALYLNTTYPNVKVVYIQVGTNDNYNDKGVKELNDLIVKIFPNAKKVVLPGTLGWGGLCDKNNGPVKSKCKGSSNKTKADQDTYYQIYKNLGWVYDYPACGETCVNVGTDAEAHNSNNEYFKAILKIINTYI